MKLLNELKALGYNVILEGDRIRATYTLSGNPPADRVKPLLDELRNHKDDVISHLKAGVAEPVNEKPYWQKLDGSCRICRTTGAWLSIHNVLVCLTCHPPAHEKLVARWGHA
ncbi:MAG TPA: hypothetical protein DCR39_08470 [Nitrospiraceae bacterium]|nr:hypothetical protein [Nitrospiraceae bacterium]